MITDNQQKQVNYNDQAIAQMKSRRQELIIEKKEYDKILKIREDMMLKSLKRVKGEEKVIFINHLMKFIRVSEITEEMKEQEQNFITNQD